MDAAYRSTRRFPGHRVMVCGKEDQLQIDIETQTTSVNGNTRTQHTGMVLPPEFTEQFIAACQTYWEPAR